MNNSNRARMAFQVSQLAHAAVILTGSGQYQVCFEYKSFVDAAGLQVRLVEDVGDKSHLCRFIFSRERCLSTTWARMTGAELDQWERATIQELDDWLLYLKGLYEALEVAA